MAGSSNGKQGISITQWVLQVALVLAVLMALWR
jgi:hypothetical protein